MALWEVAIRKLRGKRSAPKHYNWVQRFSPDGRLLGRITDANTVEVWDVLGGQKVATFAGHDSPIQAFAFTRDGRHLITASDDCTLLAWDLAGPAASARAEQKTAVPADKELVESWQALGSADAGNAFAAIRTLVSAPERAADLIRTKLKVPVPLDAASVQRLLAELGSDSFAVRARASQELTALGDMVETPLRRFLAENPPLEAKRRAEQILAAVVGPISAQRLRPLRAVEVLEIIGDDGARAVLRRLAKGPPEASVTREATATLRRMEARR
jgi:hypothetical protein